MRLELTLMADMVNGNPVESPLGRRRVLPNTESALTPRQPADRKPADRNPTHRNPTHRTSEPPKPPNPVEEGRLTPNNGVPSGAKVRQTAVAITILVVLVVGATYVVGRQSRPRFDRVGGGPMRLLPMWTPPGQTPLNPRKFNIQSGATRQDIGTFIGFWESDEQRLIIEVRKLEPEFPIGMFRRGELLELDEAIASGPELLGDPVLEWSVGTTSNPVSAMIQASSTTPWANVAEIARSIIVNETAPSFTVGKPLGLSLIYLGPLDEITTSQRWFYGLRGDIQISRLSKNGMAVSRGFSSGPNSVVTPISVRGRVGYSTSTQATFTADVNGQLARTPDRVVTVAVEDGEWLISASGLNRPVNELVRLLDGLEQATEEEWDDAVLAATLPAGDTIASARSPKRIASVGTSDGLTWTLSIARIPQRSGCFTAHFTIVGTEKISVCVPVPAEKNAPITLFAPTIVKTPTAHLALLFTIADVETIVTPQENVATDRIVVNLPAGYRTFSFAVVVVPSGVTRMATQLVRVGNDRRARQIEGPTIKIS